MEEPEVGGDTAKKRPQFGGGVGSDVQAYDWSQTSRLVWSYLLSAVKVIECGQVPLNKLSKHSL